MERTGHILRSLMNDQTPWTGTTKADYRGGIMSAKQSIWSGVPSYRIQTCEIEDALRISHSFFKASRVVQTPQLRVRLRTIGYAYLNRVCELACTPLHQRYVETSNGAELAWFTYRPEAVATNCRSIADAPVLIGYVDDLTETEARSRAIGW